MLLGLWIIGSRQLALAITMHDTAHQSMFRSLWLNRFLGQVFASWPVLQDVHQYREYHLRHHRYAGTDEDPDLKLAANFPISKQRFWRNVRRDLTGAVGFKSLIGSLLMLAHVLEYNVAGVVKVKQLPNMSRGQRVWLACKGLAGPVGVQVLMLILLSVFANAWLYLLWLGAYMTTYMFLLRIRSIAEHALTDDPFDALNNARTTHVNWFERLLLAPLHVNYHLEHHMLMGVPQQNLPKLHQMLRDKGVFEQRKAAVEHGYLSVLRKAVK